MDKKWIQTTLGSVFGIPKHHIKDGDEGKGGLSRDKDAYEE